MDLNLSDIAKEIEEQGLNDVYLGSYNPEKKLESTISRFNTFIEEFRNKPIYEKEQEEGNKIKDGNEKKIYFVGKSIDRLKREISKFQGPHINQMYRRLHEKCIQLQLDLDRIKVTENPNLGTEKKRAILRIESLNNDLFNKVHSEQEKGKCNECS